MNEVMVVVGRIVKTLQFVMNCIALQDLTILKNKLVQAFIGATHKFKEEAFLTHYLLDICRNVHLHPNGQKWRMVTKLFCVFVLFRVGTTNYSQLLREKNDQSSSEIDLFNFNFLLPCGRAIKQSIPPFKWHAGVSTDDIE